MSVHVTTDLKTRPECTEQAINKLRDALAESLQREGCEAIHLRRDQDDPTHIVSFTQWARRQDYENYLAWRTETGFRTSLTPPICRAAMPTRCQAARLLCRRAG